MNSHSLRKSRVHIFGEADNKIKNSSIKLLFIYLFLNLQNLNLGIVSLENGNIENGNLEIVNWENRNLQNLNLGILSLEYENFENGNLGNVSLEYGNIEIVSLESRYRFDVNLKLILSTVYDNINQSVKHF